MPARANLTAGQAAALTRRVLSYCIGRGSISRQNRGWVLKINHPSHREGLAAYQWEQLKEFLPGMRCYRWVPGYSDRAAEGAGNWCVRVTSRYFETAYRLLYPQGEYLLRSPVLELLGAEGIASLWADRAQMLESPNRHGVLSKLVLLRHDEEAAHCVRDWLYTLTGAISSLGHVSYSPHTPVLQFDRQATMQVMESISHTWHATAPLLRSQFEVPIELRQEILERMRQKRMQTSPDALTTPARASHGPTREALRIETDDAPLVVPDLSPPALDAPLVVPDLSPPRAA